MGAVTALCVMLTDLFRALTCLSVLSPRSVGELHQTSRSRSAHARQHPDQRHSSYITPHRHSIPLHSTPLHSTLSLHFDTASNKSHLGTHTTPFPLLFPFLFVPHTLTSPHAECVPRTTFHYHSTRHIYSPIHLTFPPVSLNPFPSPLIFYTLSRGLPLHIFLFPTDQRQPHRLGRAPPGTAW